MYKINLPHAQSKQMDGFLFHWVTQNTSAPYLYFVTGSSHGAWCYENYFRYFYGLGYNIASMDWLGRGGMPMGDNFCLMSTQDIVDASINAIASTPDIKNYIVIGHSIGALPSGQIASQDDKATGLILLAPSPHAQIAGAEKLPTIATDKPAPIGTKDAIAKRYWPHITDATLIDELYEKLVPESPTLKNERFTVSVTIDWQKNKCPALVIEAGLDDPRWHPAGQDQKIADFYQGDYIHMPNAGHCMMYGNHWRESAEHIKNWLNKAWLKESTK